MLIVKKRKTILYIGKKYFEKIIDKFDIKSDKTYQPPKLTKIKDDLLFSLTIGFIDGDGTINKKGGLHIKCHESWKNNIEYMLENMSEKYSIYNYENLVIGSLQHNTELKKIKEKIIVLGLPILERKWDRIDLKKDNRYQKYEKLNLKCIELLNGGNSVIDICQKLGLSESYVYKIRNTIKEREIKRDIERIKSYG